MDTTKIFIMSLILGSILFLIGCTAPEQTAEEPEETIETINEEFVISGIENGECVVPEINLFSSSNLISTNHKLENACSGIRVTAFEMINKTDELDRILYHVKTFYGASGWLTNSFVGEICQTNNDCDNLGSYSEYATNPYTGEREWKFQHIPSTCLNGICVECTTTRDCSESSVCDTTKNKCVECLSNNDCDTSYNRIVDKLTCDTEENKCVECLTDNDCPASSDEWDKNEKFCEVAKFTSILNECVECRDNYDCPEDKYCSHSGSCDNR